MDVLYLASIWISGLALIVMTVVIPIGVFNRYVLGSGSQWPEPLAILCMVVFTFMGAAASLSGGRAHRRDHAHRSGARDSSGTKLAFLVDVLMAALCALHDHLRLGSSARSPGTRPSPSSRALSVGVTYLPLPVGAAVTLLFVIEQFFFGSQTHRAAGPTRGDPSSEEITGWGRNLNGLPSSFSAAFSCCSPIGTPVAYTLGLVSVIGALWIEMPLDAVMIQIASGRQQVLAAGDPLLRAGRRHHGGRRHGASADRLRRRVRRLHPRRPVAGQHPGLDLLRRDLGLVRGRHGVDRLGDDSADGEEGLSARLRHRGHRSAARCRRS